MAMFRGIDVTLYEPVRSGTDAFGAAVFTERPVVIGNVLVSPSGSSDAPDELQLSRRVEAYELCIPKGDDHTWQGASVEFFGRRFQVVGIPMEWMEHLLPLDWNRKVRVERYV